MSRNPKEGSGRLGPAATIACVVATAAMVASAVAVLALCLGRPAAGGQAAQAEDAQAGTAQGETSRGEEGAMGDWDRDRAAEAARAVVLAQTTMGEAERLEAVDRLVADDAASQLRVNWGASAGVDGGLEVPFALFTPEGAGDGEVGVVFFARKAATGRAHSTVVAAYDADREGFTEAELYWAQATDDMLDGDYDPVRDAYPGLGEPDGYDEQSRKDLDRVTDEAREQNGAARARMMEDAGVYDRILGKGADDEGSGE